MDSEDDICILPSSPEDDVDVDAGSHPVISFSGLLPTNRTSADHGSHHALQKAYLEVKRRLNETTQHNQKLSRRVQELESSQRSDSFITIGDSFDMMDDARSTSQGTAGMQHMADAVVGAEEGYINSLQRQLARSKSQLQAMENMYQEQVHKSDTTLAALTEQLHESQAQVVQLSQEKAALQQTCELAEREKQMALQSLHGMKEKCESLTVERDKAMKEGTSLQLSLQKAHQEVAMLKEKRDDSLTLEPPAELVSELARMRRVIDSLKKMVLAQREHLASQGMSLSMRSNLSQSLRDPPSTQTELSPHTGARSGGSPSGHSWEMVNGTAPSSSELQQRSGQSSPRPDLAKNIAATGRPIINGNAGDVGNGQVTLLPGQKAKTDIVRRRSEEDASKPKCKTEIIRSNTHPHAPRLGEWMGTHYQQQGVAMQPDQIGLNQFVQTPATASQGGTIQSRPTTGVQYPPAPASQHQGSPAREPISTYDNFAANTVNNNNNVVGPSMHILNQSSMTGARVLQSGSGSFTGAGSGGRSVTPTYQNPVALARDGAAHRASPQEHTEPARPLSPSHLLPNQVQPIRFANEVQLAAPSKSPSKKGLDRKCPVCGQDFAHITMDEFQTHVFECFDDADDTSSAPETLQPQPTSPSKPGVSSDRICPMCNQRFDDMVPQHYFEEHVQSHFEEVANHFEVLDIHRS